MTITGKVAMSDGEFDQLREIVYKRSGIHFPPSKKYILESRLCHRLRELELQQRPVVVDGDDTNGILGSGEVLGGIWLTGKGAAGEAIAELGEVHHRRRGGEGRLRGETKRIGRAARQQA